MKSGVIICYSNREKIRYIKMHEFFENIWNKFQSLWPDFRPKFELWTLKKSPRFDRPGAVQNKPLATLLYCMFTQIIKQDNNETWSIRQQNCNCASKGRSNWQPNRFIYIEFIYISFIEIEWKKRAKMKKSKRRSASTILSQFD